MVYPAPLALHDAALQCRGHADFKCVALRRAAAAATLAIGSKAAMLAKSAGGAGGFVKGIGLLAAGTCCDVQH